jgi:hypothetical protein
MNPPSTKGTTPERLVYGITLTLLFLLFCKLLAFQWSLLGNPFPNEYREGSILVTTQALLDGKNPYALAQQPEYTNVYGILYHLVVYPFAKLFGNSFPIHRSVSAAFLIATCGAMVWIMRWMRTPWVINLGASLILYGHLLFYITPLARPDAMGVFLMVLSVILPFRFRYSDRSLIASIVLGLLAFFTKPYFILGLAFVLTYVFTFQSKGKGLRYVLYATLGFLGSMAAMNAWGESYINNTFLIHVNVASKSADFLYKQLSTYLQCNLGLLGLLAGGSGFLLWQGRSHLKSHLKASLKPQLTSWEHPLFQWDMGLFPWCSWLAFTIFYISMGRHTGNWMVYLHQLLSPFLLLSLAGVGKQIYEDSASIRRLVIQGLASGLIVLNVASVTSTEFLPGLPKDYVASWQTLSTIVSQHKRIFNSPAIAALLLQQGKPVPDSGQSQYFINGVERKAKLSSFFPSNNALIDRNNAYLNQVEQDVINRRYDLVIITQSRSPILPEDFLTQHYTYAGSIHAPMPPAPFIGPRNWLLDVYQPNSVAAPTK